MSTATRLNTDMGGWMPETRHYQVEGGYLAVTVANFLTATGTSVFLADATGGASSTEPIRQYPDGTTHSQALEALGYIVIDSIGTPSPPEPEPVAPPPEQSVIDILPPEIAAMVAAATEGS